MFYFFWSSDCFQDDRRYYLLGAALGMAAVSFFAVFAGLET
jgi:hypothetical protein